ncbi:MAG: Copper binding protein plastocyanin/azurin family [Solirubrobacteraceae bacterium]|nr:Copper binding protein plastocyanin/azurin family [Solirubrobacteraceae bacterium]
MTARRLAALALATAVASGALPAATGGHPGHGATTIGISLYGFHPERVDVIAGDVVFWRWDGPDTDHSVTGSGPGKTFESDPGKAPADLTHQTGETYGEQFTQPGTYSFHCRKHDTMRGVVVVAADVGGGPVPVDRVAPRLTGVALVPATMCRRCRRPGARLRFALSERADLEADVRRVRRGSRRLVRTLQIPGRQGRNDVRFNPAGLVAGTYELRLRAYDSQDNASAVAKRGFVVR